MSDNKFNAEKITMLEYKILKGQIDAPEEFSLEQVAAHEITNSFDMGIDIEHKKVRTQLDVKIKTKCKIAVPQEAEGHFTLVYIFTVENLDELATLNSDGLVELHPHLGNALATVTYSTSRGIFLTRFQGTALQNFILPVIGADKLIKI